MTSTTADWNRHATDLHRRLARTDENLACVLMGVILVGLILGGML